MTTPPSAHTARLARIETALSRATGLNHCIKLHIIAWEDAVSWLSQVDEVQKLLTGATIALSELRREGASEAISARSPQ